VDVLNATVPAGNTAMRRSVIATIRGLFMMISQKLSQRQEGAFGVVASLVEPWEVGVTRWDGSDVLGAVELPDGVFVVAVEAHGNGAAAEVWG
jgi:hypothetical protein